VTHVVSRAQGHNNGTVTLRTPNLTTPAGTVVRTQALAISLHKLATMFVGPGPVQALAVDHAGLCARARVRCAQFESQSRSPRRYMAAAQIDGRVRVFDLRTYKALHS
jgi:hypothetical protein